MGICFGSKRITCPSTKYPDTFVGERIFYLIEDGSSLGVSLHKDHVTKIESDV